MMGNWAETNLCHLVFLLYFQNVQFNIQMDHFKKLPIFKYYVIFNPKSVKSSPQSNPQFSFFPLFICLSVAFEVSSYSCHIFVIMCHLLNLVVRDYHFGCHSLECIYIKWEVFWTSWETAVTNFHDSVFGIRPFRKGSDIPVFILSTFPRHREQAQNVKFTDIERWIEFISAKVNRNSLITYTAKLVKVCLLKKLWWKKRYNFILEEFILKTNMSF